jgi:Uma2 family endonuclease
MVALGLMTSADLDKLPEIPGVRYEIIDGELYVSRQPTLGHQYASGESEFALELWNKQTNAGFVFATPGLVFAEDQDVVPDVVWISHERLAEAQDEHGHLKLAPELIVEVLSPGPANELRDRRLKLDLYSRQGVLEYWIVDWRRHAVEIYRHTGTELQLVSTLDDLGAISSPLLPGFSLSVATLWATSLR